VESYGTPVSRSKQRKTDTELASLRLTVHQYLQNIDELIKLGCMQHAAQLKALVHVPSLSRIDCPTPCYMHIYMRVPVDAPYTLINTAADDC
jgi:hypothetical protein